MSRIFAQLDDKNQIVWWGYLNGLPQGSAKNVITVPKIYEDLLKESTQNVSYSGDIPPVYINDKKNNKRLAGSVMAQVSTVVRVDLPSEKTESLISLSLFDFNQLQQAYEASGLEEVLATTSKPRRLEILTVDFLNLSIDSTGRVYKRIINSFNDVLKGLSEEKIRAVKAKVEILLESAPLPLKLEDNGMLYYDFDDPVRNANPPI